MKILIVEDNEDNRRLIGKRLRAAGHTLLEATSGAAALEVLHAGRPDLVLLDLQLPDVPGLELLHRIRTVEAIRDVVVVACTAFAMAGDEGRALAAGCDGYITKPVDIRLLPTQLEEIYHAHRR